MDDLAVPLQNELYMYIYMAPYDITTKQLVEVNCARSATWCLYLAMVPIS